MVYFGLDPIPVNFERDYFLLTGNMKGFPGFLKTLLIARFFRQALTIFESSGCVSGTKKDGEKEWFGFLLGRVKRPQHCW